MEENEMKKKKGGFGLNLIKCVVFAVVFGLIAGGIVFAINGKSGEEAGASSSVLRQADDSAAPEQSLQTVETGATEGTYVSDVSDVVEEVMPSIVSITTIGMTEYYDFFGTPNQFQSEGSGSGIIVADDADLLYIATNNHVVEGATSLTVCFADNETAEGSVKGTQPGSDLAVVTVAKADLKDSTKDLVRVAKLGDSSSLRVGEPAIAIGNALGYGQSVTTGVISALDRQITAQDNSGNSMTNTLIQTDAAINPGNSGGALLNAVGEVIGINSVKYTDTSVEGMGYAIPISTAEPIINDLIEREVVAEAEQAYLGIAGVDVTASAAATYDMPEGIFIARIEPGTAAEAAGLQKGDIITGFNGHDISTMDELKSDLSYCEAGKEVELKYKRANDGQYEENTITVTLGKRPAGQ
jgi:serine protease Do